MICSALLPVNQVFASNAKGVQGENEAVQYTIKKDVAEDKTSIKITLDMQEKENIKVKRVLLPDGKEQSYDGSHIEVIASKNGVYQFKISYEKEESTMLKVANESKTLVADISVNVTESAQEKAEVKNQGSQKKEESRKKQENLEKSSLSREVTELEALQNSILSAVNGVETTLNINTNIVVDKEITIPSGKIIRFAGNGSLVRTEKLDKGSHMIKIVGGGHLFLDGITVDGNNMGDKNQAARRVGSAIEVLGEFTIISGKLTQHTCYVIHVSGVEAKLAMNGGIIENNEASSGIFLEDHANFVMNGGEISNNTFDNYSGMEVNTIALRNGSKFVLNDGLITNNTHWDLSGTIFVSGGRNGRNEDASSFVMNGGVISNNFSSGVSGGVTVGTWGNPDYQTIASFEMNGGIIANNTSRYAGGGVLNMYNGDFKMNNGQITDNKAPVGGGVAINDGFVSAGAGDAGFTIEQWGTVFNCPGSFTMNDGEISGNSTNEAIQPDGSEGVGGGVYIASNEVTFNAGIISNNTAEDQGGGIYVASVPYELQMYNTLITENTASLLGGGIWSCPTGNVEIHVTNGGALFDNAAPGTAAGDDFVAVPNRHSLYTTTFAKRMLGGGKIAYFGDGGVVADDVLGQPDLSVPRFDSSNPGFEFENINNSMEGYALKTVATESAKFGALKKAYVSVTGNHAKRGGGIGTNGSVVIGTPDMERLHVTKRWQDFPPLGTNTPEYIFINLMSIDKDGNEALLETVELSARNNWEHSFVDLGTEYTYEVREHPIFGFETTYEKIRDEEGNITYITIINTRETVAKEVSKIWDDQDNQDGTRPTEVKVQIYADNIAIGDAILLNADNGWTYKWEKLAKVVDGKEVVYSVKEVDVADGYTDKVEIDTNGNFTLINTHIVVPEKPADPTQPSTPNSGTDVPKTGDSKNLNHMIVLLLGSFSLFIVALMRNKYKKS